MIDTKSIYQNYLDGYNYIKLLLKDDGEIPYPMDELSEASYNQNTGTLKISVGDRELVIFPNNIVFLNKVKFYVNAITVNKVYIMDLITLLNESDSIYLRYIDNNDKIRDINGKIISLSAKMDNKYSLLSLFLSSISINLMQETSSEHVYIEIVSKNIIPYMLLSLIVKRNGRLIYEFRDIDDIYSNNVTKALGIKRSYFSGK